MFIPPCVCFSQSRIRWSRERARWWPSIAVATRIRLRSDLKPSSAPASQGRLLGRPEPDPPVLKVNMYADVHVNDWITVLSSSSIIPQSTSTVFKKTFVIIKSRGSFWDEKDGSLHRVSYHQHNTPSHKSINKQNKIEDTRFCEFVSYTTDLHV